jgi:hypothetical protein
MNIEQKRAKIKALIEEAETKFMSLTFTKKDGTERTMNIQPAGVKKHLVKEYKTSASKKAVETRKNNHPELISVWDVQKSGIRSINMDTVTSITSDGVIYNFVTKTKVEMSEKAMVSQSS